MKTKPKKVSDTVNHYRKYIKSMVRNYHYSKMVAWSIQHLINPGFKIEVTDNVLILPYNPKFQPKADQWDAQVARIAKWFNKEPAKRIGKDTMEASIFMHHTIYLKEPAWKERWTASVYVYIRSHNSESCEIEMVKEVVERPKLTGYCAALEAKKYMDVKAEPESVFESL